MTVKEKRQATERKMNEVPKRYRQIYQRAISGTGSPREAIQAFCLECVNWVKDEVQNCTAQTCPLFMFRPYCQNVTGSPREGLGNAESEELRK